MSHSKSVLEMQQVVGLVGLKLVGLAGFEFASRLRRASAAAHVKARAGLPMGQFHQPFCKGSNKQLGFTLEFLQYTCSI